MSPPDALCRVCHTASPRCLPLFKPLSNLIAGKLATLATILSYCSGLEILESELFLPHHICPGCVAKLRLSLEFKRSVHRMDRLLRQSHADFCRSKRINAGQDPRDRLSPEIPEDFVLVLDEQEVAGYAAETMRNEADQLVVESDEEEPRIQKERLDLELERQEELPEKENCEEQHSHTIAEIYLDPKAGEDLYEVIDDAEQRLVEAPAKSEPLASKSRQRKSKPVLQCLICGKELSSKRTFQHHMTLHGSHHIRQENHVHSMEDSLQIEPVVQAKAGEDLYEIVEKAEQPVSSRSRLWKPLNPSLQCQICGKQLSTNNSFKYHMQLHGTATPYVCKICGESFKTRNAHDGHVTLHDRNNPNRCPTCFKVYRQASSLRTHLLIHSGIKPFECSICGKRLTQKSGYKKHMLTHTGEKPHSCDICGRSFRYSSNLIAHKRCHSQEKPHHCQVCQKRSFGSRSELNRHMLVHSSERPFGCEQCGKSFKRQISLGIHLQSHAPGRQRKRGDRRKTDVLLEQQDQPEET
ncbi:zinc finger protein 3 homolog [Drosophila teissieri]|uniref:zinc finger protein 3 homolog n=1 Tax=Drosophila teissieri TaxID=7243 RepID=UPI001CBA4C4E|nr:zinc finger protein 3 homolog [Drosophila teissieri]